MRALFLRQRDKYRQQWYDQRGITPPNLGKDRNKGQNKARSTVSITDTYVVEGFQPTTQGDDHLELSYWETTDAGIEPLEFWTSRNMVKSDTVVGWTELPLPEAGAINRCFTPYENDIMSYEAFEVTRKELKHRGEHLANEMKRVDETFHRGAKKNWFCLKGAEFTKEHVRHNEMMRRNAQRMAFIGDQKKS